MPPVHATVLSFAGCPNHGPAVEVVRRVAARSGHKVTIGTVMVQSPEDAERLGFLGSPSVQINGVDVEPAARDRRNFGMSCRTYGGRGVPSDHDIEAAIREAETQPPGLRTSSRRVPRNGHMTGGHEGTPSHGATPEQGACTGSRTRPAVSLGRALLAMPAAVLPLLPSATCPLCIAGYASTLSALGLGFLVTERTLRPLILVLVGVCVLSAAWSAYRRRRWGSVTVAVVGAAAVVAGRIIWEVPVVLYAGATLLVIASFWGTWPGRRVQPTTVELEVCHDSVSSCCCGDGVRAKAARVGRVDRATLRIDEPAYLSCVHNVER